MNLPGLTWPSRPGGPPNRGASGAVLRHLRALARVDAILEGRGPAGECPEFEFELIGSGQLYPAIRATAARCGLTKVTFVDTRLNGRRAG